MRATTRLVGAVSCVLAIAGATAAFATPPGSNGRIAFTRYTGANPDSSASGSIWTVAADGTGERRVTRASRGIFDFQPDWTRDGSRIVFERETGSGSPSIWTVRPDGSELHELVVACPAGIPSTEIWEENSPAWSADGRRIAFGQAYGKLKHIRGDDWIEVGAVSVMDADGSNVHKLTQLRRPTSSEDGEPVWSPDGKRIAFARLNSTAKPVDGRAVFVINADGTGLRQVTPWRLKAGHHPDWSPDGTRILFRSPADEFDASNLWTVRPDGSGLKQLTHFGPSILTFSASFAPDGEWIVLSRSGRGGPPDLFAIRPNGSGLRQVTRTTVWDSAPDWGPR
jgi:TolB protein